MRKGALFLGVFLVLVGASGWSWAVEGGAELRANIAVGYPWKTPCRGFAVKSVEMKYAGRIFKIRGDGKLAFTPRGMEVSRDGKGRVEALSFDGHWVRIYYAKPHGEMVKVETDGAGGIVFQYRDVKNPEEKVLVGVVHGKRSVRISYRDNYRRFYNMGGKLPGIRVTFKE